MDAFTSGTYAGVKYSGKYGDLGAMVAAVLLDTEVPDELPFNEYFEYYGPDYRLHIQPSNMENFNSHKYLEDTKYELLEYLSRIEKPSVQIQTGQPGTSQTPKSVDFGRPREADPDERESREQKDARKLVLDPHHARVSYSLQYSLNFFDYMFLIFLSILSKIERM